MAESHPAPSCTLLRTASLCLPEFPEILIQPVSRANPSAWPPLPKDQTSSMIACCEHPDSATVTALLRRRPDTYSSCIVVQEETIPTSLRGRFPKALLSLLRRPLLRDLIVAVHPDSPQGQSASPDGSMLEVVLQQTPKSAALSGKPSSERLPAPGPGRPPIRFEVMDVVVREQLQKLGISGMTHDGLLAGILLLWDFLDESHSISQTMEGRGSPRTGDYWHGIMHRREPDAGNSAYWFRRVGHHPALDALGSQLQTWMSELQADARMLEIAARLITRHGTFDAMAMITLSGQALKTPGSPEDEACRLVQTLEILNLLAFSL